MHQPPVTPLYYLSRLAPPASEACIPIRHGPQLGKSSFHEIWSPPPPNDAAGDAPEPTPPAPSDVERVPRELPPTFSPIYFGVHVLSVSCRQFSKRQSFLLTQPKQCIFDMYFTRNCFVGRAPIDSVRLPTSVFAIPPALMHTFSFLQASTTAGGRSPTCGGELHLCPASRVASHILVRQVFHPPTVSRHLNILMVRAAMFA